MSEDSQVPEPVDPSKTRETAQEEEGGHPLAPLAIIVGVLLVIIIAYAMGAKR